MKKFILSLICLLSAHSLKATEPTHFEVNPNHKFLSKIYLERLPNDQRRSTALSLEKNFLAASDIAAKVFEAYKKFKLASLWQHANRKDFPRRFIESCHVLASIESLQKLNNLDSLLDRKATEQHIANALVVRPHVCLLYVEAALFIERIEKESDYTLEMKEEKAETYYRVFLAIQEKIKENLSDSIFQAIYNETEGGEAHLKLLQEQLNTLIRRWGVLLVMKTKIDPSEPVDLSDFPWDSISFGVSAPQTSESLPKKRMRQESQSQ